MQKEEFAEEIERLKIVYGEKNFPQERNRILWEQFKNERADIFRKAISNIIAEQYTAPTASKIKEILSFARDIQIKNQIAEVNYDCSWCGQSGFVYVYEKSSMEEGLMKCQCDFAFLFAKARVPMYEPHKMLNMVCKFWADEATVSGPHKVMHHNNEEEAKRLADKYAPEIRKLLNGGIGPGLPYDPGERIEA